MFMLRQAGPTLIMSCRAIRALVVCTALVSMPLQAAHRWTGLTTPHFEMYTNNSMGSGTKALETFERVRSFFLDNSPSKHAPDTPVRIIAFRSEKDFEPYRPNDGAFAYYQRSRKRDYIVMQDLSPEHYRTAVHEYTHLIVEHSGLKLPTWLNEGLADLYSSMEPKGNQTMVGRPIEGHLIVLGNEKWLDLALLTSVRQDSPYYNERTKMQIFYAESLNGYFHHRTIQVSLFDSKLEKLDLQPEGRDLSALQTELALADLLSGQTRKAAQAKERLDRIAAEYPQSAEVEESVGYFAWQGADARGAA